MTRRSKFTRCCVCKSVPNDTQFVLSQFSQVWGWHKTLIFCGPCARELFALVHQRMERRL